MVSCFLPSGTYGVPECGWPRPSGSANPPCARGSRASGPREDRACRTARRDRTTCADRPRRQWSSRSPQSSASRLRSNGDSQTMPCSIRATARSGWSRNLRCTAFRSLQAARAGSGAAPACRPSTSTCRVWKRSPPSARTSSTDTKTSILQLSKAIRPSRPQSLERVNQRNSSAQPSPSLLLTGSDVVTILSMMRTKPTSTRNHSSLRHLNEPGSRLPRTFTS